MQEFAHRQEKPVSNLKNEWVYIGASYRKKDLGIIIDNELKFHKHTAMAIKKANRILGLIKKSFVNLDTNSLPLLYKSLVRPHLEYGNIIWGPHYKEDQKALEKV